MTRVLLDEDGLLQRFGRPDPDAAGFVAALERLQAGLARRPRPRAASDVERARQHALSLDVAAVRFTGSTAVSRGESVSELPLRVLDGVWDLTPGDLFFTASHTRLATARRHEVIAHAVGLERLDDDRVVDVSEAPRLVEEALRVPTPRPRSPATRRGGLVAIPVGSHAEARAEALEAVRTDPHADWTHLGDHLLLYTEDPDLEDELAERPGADRLSYAVARGDIVVEVRRAAPDGDDEVPGAPDDTAAHDRRAARGQAPADTTDVLFGRGDVIVREMPSSIPRSAPDASDTPASAPEGTGGSQRPWRDVRRRFVHIATSGRDDRGTRDQPPASHQELAAFRARIVELESNLRPRLRVPVGETLLAALHEVVGYGAAVDAWPAGTLGPPRYVAWQTPYGDPESDDLLILRHDLHAQHRDPARARPMDRGVLVRQVAVAVATAEFLSQRPSALGTLHVLDMPSASAETGDEAPTPTSVFILTAERNRVRAALTFPPGADETAGLQSVLSQLHDASRHGR